MTNHRDTEALFACATGPFAHTLLGSHDGRESWTVRVGQERSRNEQLLVSLHEKKHHELQTSSPWGFLMMLTGAIDTDNVMTPWLADGCRQTHELFATYFSTGTDKDFLELLDTNPTYLTYYKRAVQLADTAGGSARLIDALLRSAMASAELGELSGTDVLALRPNDIARRWMPDARLQAIEEALEQLSLQADLEDLATDTEGLVNYRDQISAALDAVGVPTMTFADQQQWTHQVVVDINQSPHAEMFNIEVLDVEPDDRLASDLNDFSRERLQLHNTRLPLEVINPDQLRDRATDFARAHHEFGVHSLVIWLRRDLVATQFDTDLSEFGDTDRPVLGLLSCDRVNGAPIARLCAFDQMPPSVLWAATAETHQLLFLTTLATIVDTPAEETFNGIDPVFALIDQPMIEFCQHTFDQEVPLRWRVVAIDGDRDLSMFVFENTNIANMFYLSFATAATRHQLGRWLTERNDDLSIQDSDLAANHEHALAALVEHIIGTFWRLDQFGGRRPNDPVADR